jgi:membrane protease YdiL (CAAX protease family)
MNPMLWWALPGLALELILYFLPGLERLTARVKQWPEGVRALFVALSGLTPVLLMNAGVGQPVESLGLLAGSVAAVVVAAWLLPRKPMADLLLMAVLAAMILSPVYKPVYPELQGGPRLDGLAKLLWLRLGMMVFVYLRGYRVPGAAPWPQKRDWLVGGAHFAVFFGLLLPVGLYLEFLRPAWPKVETWLIGPLAAGTFLGMYLFVAYGEEFFFRGILQPLLQKGLGSRWLGIGLASLLFGAVHLPYRNFPNWRFALLAAVAGVFYGLAYERGRSLRAAMIAHALVVTVWTVVFSRSL